MFKNIFGCLFLCIALGGSALGLDERSAKEKRCSVTLPKAFPTIDKDWAKSVTTWYISRSSKLEVYRMASDVDHVPTSEIKEDNLYNHGCFKVLWETDKFPVVQGFHGKQSETKVKQLSEGVLNFNTTNYEIPGTGVVTLTDNKTYQFFYKCYDDGEATWAVLSTLKKLDKETVDIIHEHAKSLGFFEKYFTELQFENCN